jgi:2-iminobutanoate/2-iminopropanoate deaminase
MKKIQTTGAPQAIGPYSQGIVANGIVYCSGQLGLVPETGVICEGGIVAETERVLENLSAILAAAGSTLSEVVSTTVYLQHMSDFAAMNECYAKYFTGVQPVRVTVEVAKLPKNALVEISCVAVLST